MNTVRHFIVEFYPKGDVSQKGVSEAAWPPDSGFYSWVGEINRLALGLEISMHQMQEYYDVVLHLVAAPATLKQAKTTGYELTTDEGTAVWFLVRDHAGSYDSGEAFQVGSRDEALASSSVSCP